LTRCYAEYEISLATKTYENHGTVTVTVPAFLVSPSALA
jgi:hypothetical protein